MSNKRLDERNWQPLLASVEKRLNSLLKAFFGSGFYYLSCQQLSASNRGLGLYLGRLVHDLQNQAFEHENELYHPHVFGNELQGFAVAKNSSELTHKQKNQIFELIDMIYFSLHRQCNEIDLLIRTERNLHMSVGNKNVYSLLDKRAEQKNASNEPHQKHFTNISLPVLIEGRSKTEINRLALDIHESGNRYAYIQFSHLSTAARQDFSLLMELGFVTIHIPELTDLDEGTQLRLTTYLRSSRLHRLPQILAGTCFNPTESVRCKRLLPALLQEFSKARIRMPQNHLPRTSYIPHFVQALAEIQNEELGLQFH